MYKIIIRDDIIAQNSKFKAAIAGAKCAKALRRFKKAGDLVTEVYEHKNGKDELVELRVESDNRKAIKKLMLDLKKYFCIEVTKK